MTRKNAQTLVVVAAAMAVGVAAWFADDLAGYWRAARPPAGYQGVGGGSDAAASPRVDPPSQAFVPPFDAPKMTNTELLAHYVKQVPLDKSPTLDEWQKLLDTLPKELLGATGAAGGVTLPLGRGHFVMAMCADLGGNLWIGTEGEGIFRYNPGKPAAEQWAQFTTKDGLGDDYGYAVACDQQGRVWVGHLNHGVSVFNGERWQTFEVVGGLSRPDTLNGPLGERIFKIAVCPLQATVVGAPAFHDALADKDSPMAGSVWMASSAGLAIYFPATDAWSYVTRAEGLPSDQANAIAFDRDGMVYVGTQCDGIAMAGPQDHYATWKQVTAANPVPHAVDGKIVDVAVPTVGKGAGLPTDLINDLLVAKDGTVYAATTLGLAWSTDHGNSWQYVRGADWSDKVQNRLGGAPQGWQPPTDVDHGGGILSEDYTTTMAEDAEGKLLVGHRAAAGDIVAPQAGKKLDSSLNLYVTSIVPVPGSKNAFRGTYGDGLSAYNSDSTSLGSNMASVAHMPLGAKAPSISDLRAQLSEGSSLQTASATNLGDDWITQGNWVGHFGRQAAVLFAMGSPRDHVFIRRQSQYRYSVALLGDRENDTVRSWVDQLAATETRALYDPQIGTRRIASIDDHGEGFPAAHDGPSLCLNVTIPEGTHRISLYCMNERGHADYGRNRDYLIELRKADDDKGSVLAKSRTMLTWGGVYKQFVLVGPGQFVARVNRNFSYNTICSGVFVDVLVDGCPPLTREPPLWMANILVGPKPLSEGVPPENSSLMDVSAQLAKIANTGIGGCVVRHSAAIQLYRIAVNTKAPEDLLLRWRWSLSLWNSDAQRQFDETMARGWITLQEWNPVLKSKDMRPNSPNTK